jgi:hypothetical protein
MGCLCSFANVIILRFALFSLVFSVYLCCESYSCVTLSQLCHSFTYLQLIVNFNINLLKMFSSGPQYTKLKTNLRLVINRLKLLEKKKTEQAQKSRKEIAEYIAGLCLVFSYNDFVHFL